MPHSNAIGDAVEPAADRLTLANRRGFAREDEKDRLKCVFGVMLPRQNSPTHAPDQAAMALDEPSKGALVAGRDEAPKKILVADVIDCRIMGGRARHGLNSPASDQ